MFGPIGIVGLAMTTPPLEPKKRKDYTEGELSAIRAQVYPNILDETGEYLRLAERRNIETT